MRASCTERQCRARGFTLPELVIVLVLLGVLAAVALPRLQGAVAMHETAWRDQVTAALRHARATAIGHRRLVCATVTSGSVQLAIAAAHGATTCTATLPGPDGHADWARSTTAVATTVTPAGTLYFQPSGRVTSDGAGLAASSRAIGIAGETDVVVFGETGHVQ